MKIECVTGDRLKELLPQLAELRIEVFAEWPYLYEGSLDYEMKYLSALATSPRACIVVAMEGDQVIGLSTGMPLEDAPEEMRAVYDDPKGYFYFAESVIKKAYRGRGVGKSFFEQRDRHVESLGGFHTICFAAIEREESGPESYFDPSQMWKRRGYEKQSKRSCNIEYPEHGKGMVDHHLVFWERPLVKLTV